MSLAKQIGIAMALGIVFGGGLWMGLGAEAATAFTTSYIKPFGDIFVNLLKFIVVPVVIFSLIDGFISMNDIRKVGSVGWKTVAYFLCTTALACALGLVLATVFKGSFPLLEMVEGQEYTATTSSMMDTLVGIFPSNMWAPLLSSNMLQVIVISLFLGAGILMAGEKGKLAADIVGSFYAVIMNVMMMIISLSPIGVFCMMSWVVASQGPQIISSLAIVIGVAYLGYILHGLIVYSIAVKTIAGVNPVTFLKTAAPAMIFAFSSTSSVATLPITKECCNKLDVEDEVSAFVLPLGATINMDGTAIYQCVATIFIASCMGINLTLGQMIVIVVTATLASIGTAGTSGAGMIMLTMVLQAVGIDPVYIGLIYGVDRLFDMGRTAMNVVGDVSCAVCVNHMSKKSKSEKHKHSAVHLNCTVFACV